MSKQGTDLAATTVTNPPTVLVTGCSSGIGRACVVDLAQRGWRVVAGVRREEDGAGLQREHPRSVHTVVLDITCSNSLQKASDAIAEIVGDSGLCGLINNAGILVPGPLELLSVDQMRRQFEVNVFGTHEVTKRLLPLMRRAAGAGQRPRLICIGSISGRITPPYYGAYAASKHALFALCDAWRMELQPWDFSVSLVEPDSVATPIWDKLSDGLSELSDQPGADHAHYAAGLRSTHRNGLANRRASLPPERVVAAVRHALCARRPRTHYPVGWRTRAAFCASNLLPRRWMDRLLRKAVGG